LNKYFYLIVLECKDDDDDEETQAQVMLSSRHMSKYYQDLFKYEFKQRPIIRRPGDYDLKDPTTHVRRKLIELSQQLIETITTWFRDISSKLMMLELNYEKLVIIPSSAQNVYK